MRRRSARAGSEAPCRRSRRATGRLRKPSSGACARRFLARGGAGTRLDAWRGTHADDARLGGRLLARRARPRGGASPDVPGGRASPCAGSSLTTSSARPATGSRPRRGEPRVQESDHSTPAPDSRWSILGRVRAADRQGRGPPPAARRLARPRAGPPPAVVTWASACLRRSVRTTSNASSSTIASALAPGASRPTSAARERARERRSPRAQRRRAGRLPPRGSAPRRRRRRSPPSGRRRARSPETTMSAPPSVYVPSPGAWRRSRSRVRRVPAQHAKDPRDVVVEVDAVHDRLDNHVRTCERCADDARIAMSERAHGVEDVRHRPYAPVERGAFGARLRRCGRARR